MENNTVSRHKKLWDMLDKNEEMNPEVLAAHFARHIEYTIGKFKYNTSGADIYQSIAFAVRDILIDRFNETQDHIKTNKLKRVYYLSMEFLLGRLLDCNLVNTGLRPVAKEAMTAFGYDLDELEEYEPDAGLGNGGLGRLAACFLDSLSSLNLPCTGSGLRYEFGIFHQNIVNGFQKETPDAWLSRGNPWEIMRPDIFYPVGFYGTTEQFITDRGETSVRWTPGETVMAQAFDILVPGYDTKTVNNLRLWSARASSDFNFDSFNHGDYERAVEDKVRTESISKVLYPNENVVQGKELRLKQEYMLVSATLQDAVRSFLSEEKEWERLPERVFFQMNDTHPALAPVELMRLLVDQYDLTWDFAWSLTTKSMAYTNHTVMPEALERWDLGLFGYLLPRHLEIVYRINQGLIDELRKRGIDDSKIRNVSIIEEGEPKKVRMANLAIIGSKAINGVAALHSDLLKKYIFKDFYELWPGKFQNKTNGITHRRWIVASNPSLTDLITKRIGPGWVNDLNKLRDLEAYASDPDFQNDWQAIRRKNKVKLEELIRFTCGIGVNPDSMFDVQIKRIHEYKRQLLNILQIIGDYQRLKKNPSMDYTPRTVIFGGKAAPGYHMAKLIIKLVDCVARRVNHDSDVADRLKVVFLPNYSVSLGEKLFPASDLSEQISTAGTEASGTGNMKFMLNGALTVGTLDGANVEMMEEVGKENIYIFGHTVESLNALNEKGYDPVSIYNENEEIRHILDALKWNYFNPDEAGLFQEVFHTLTFGGDHYRLLADYSSYRDIKREIACDFLKKPEWIKKSILNTARSGKFSTDRTIQDYNRDIWELKPVLFSS